MTSYFDFDSYTGFLLKQQHIEDIQDIILKQVKSTINYKVNRLNGFGYETEDIKKVLKEENFREEKITTIQIKVRESSSVPDPIEISINFSKFNSLNPVINLQVRGSNEDKVKNVSDSLKTFLLRKVIYKTPVNQFIQFLSYLCSWQLILVFSITYPTLHFLELKNKPGFLTQLFRDSFSTLVIFLILVFLLKLCEYIFPSHVFLIGEEIKIHLERQNLKQQLFWVVLIGSIISIIVTKVT